MEVSDPTKAEKAAREAAEAICDPDNSHWNREVDSVRETIMEHMQPVIDAARTEGCKPTQDDKAAAEKWLSDQFNTNQYFVNDVNSLSVMFALKRAEGRRERDGEDAPAEDAPFENSCKIEEASRGK